MTFPKKNENRDLFMRRHTGKRVTRKPRTREPIQQSADDHKSKLGINTNVHYGVITSYHGNRGQCDVKIYTEDGIMDLTGIRLKNSLRAPRLGQKLSPGALVLVDDGTIVLVYKPEKYSVIDKAALKGLESVTPKADWSKDESEEDEYHISDSESDDDDVSFNDEIVHAPDLEVELDIDQL